MYLVSLGELCEGVLRELIRELERLVDISEVETHQLHHLFTLVVSQVPSLFVVVIPPSKEKMQMPVAKYVDSWEKFCKLTELLEARYRLFSFCFVLFCLLLLLFVRAWLLNILLHLLAFYILQAV